MCVEIHFIRLGPGRKEMAYAESLTGESVMTHLFTKGPLESKKPTKDSEGPRASPSWELLLLSCQEGQEEETTF